MFSRPCAVLWLFMCVHGAAFAQATISLSPDQPRFDFGMLVERHLDPSGQEDLATVQKSIFQAGTPRIGLTDAAAWLRLRVHNPSGQRVTWWIDSGNRTVQKIALFVPDPNGNYQSQRSGAELPLAQRPLRTVTHVFPIDLAPHQTAVLYLRAQSTGYLGTFLQPRVWQPQAYQDWEAACRAEWLLYIGMATALALFNLLLFGALRDLNYLRYVASVLALVFAASVNGAGWGFGGMVWFADYPEWDQAAAALSALPIALFPTWFARRFMDEHYSLPRLYRSLNICIVLVALVSAIQVNGTVSPTRLSPKILLATFPLAVLLFSYLVIATTFATWTLLRRGNRRAVFMFIAWTPIFLATAESFIVPFTNSYPGRNHMMWANAFELIMMALALADRINVERDSKEQAQSALVEGLQRSEAQLEQKIIVRTQELQHEQARAQALLHNILPQELAAELADTGHAKPARHEAVSILFTDFCGFTETASAMPADRMVAELGDIFAAFDDITDAHGIEKIKTIGDAYMAAAGLPKACPDHAERCVRAGLAMIDYLVQRNEQSPFKWRLRVGIHSGPVVAGVVGKRKYAYDIWGDTVNLAARMESAGEAGKVNLSAYTFDLVRASYPCTYRGKLAAKGKGDIDMYFVNSAA